MIFVSCTMLASKFATTQISIPVESKFVYEMANLLTLLKITIPVSVEVVTTQSAQAPVGIKHAGRKAMAATTEHYGDHAHIWINKDLITRQRCIQLAIMLHEIAHVIDRALDPRNAFSKEEIENLTHYVPIKACIGNTKGALLREWYADWQAIQWLKKLFPQEANKLRDFYAFYVRKKAKSPHFPKYPSYQQLLAWLST